MHAEEYRSETVATLRAYTNRWVHENQGYPPCNGGNAGDQRCRDSFATNGWFNDGMSRNSVCRTGLIAVPWILAVLAVLTARDVLGEDIYRWTDAQGRPVYSDRPLSRSAERLTIPHRPRGSADAQAQAAKDLAELVSRQEERERRHAAEQAETQLKAAAERERAERCTAARNRYLMFVEANRLYRRDEAGNRVYYTGAEIDAEREASKRQMEQACANQQR